MDGQGAGREDLPGVGAKHMIGMIAELAALVQGLIGRMPDAADR